MVDDDETWRPLPGRDRYWVSSLGRIRGPRGIRKQTVRSDGYLWLNFSDGRQVSVHRMVLLAFFGEPESGQVGRHLDGDPLNNRLTNLRWGSLAQNYADRHGHGTDNSGERHGNAKLTDEIVRQIRASSRTARDWARSLGVSASCIDSVMRGRSWRHVA